MEKDFNMFHLVDHEISLDDNEFGSREVDDELAIIIPKEDMSSSTA